MSDNEKRITFEGWFSLSMPETWGHEIDEDVLDIYDNKNGDGALQISFFRRKKTTESLR